MRNRASELRIPCSDSLPLGHRLHGERVSSVSGHSVLNGQLSKSPIYFPFVFLFSPLFSGHLPDPFKGQLREVRVQASFRQL